MNKRPQILLTNDDGIQSPGLWAAAIELSKLGFVTIAAPREQVSATGRSLPITSDGTIRPQKMKIGEQEWTVYAVGGTPAQAVLHAVFEIMPERPDLVVAGINYGENVGTGITLSGTVGAAIEAGALDIPALAVSLQVEFDLWLSHSKDIDFSPSAHFTRLFAQSILEKGLPPDVDLLKVDIPDNATIQTPWHATRVARHRYYLPYPEREGTWEDKGRISAYVGVKPGEVPEDSDVYAIAFGKFVSVTPLSIDLTSRVDLQTLENNIRAGFN
jgi:5'-nucleotidase